MKTKVTLEHKITLTDGTEVNSKAKQSGIIGIVLKKICLGKFNSKDRE